MSCLRWCSHDQHFPSHPALKLIKFRGCPLETKLVWNGILTQLTLVYLVTTQILTPWPLNISTFLMNINAHLPQALLYNAVSIMYCWLAKLSSIMMKRKRFSAAIIQILLTGLEFICPQLSVFVSNILKLCAIISLQDNFIKFLSKGNT